ncbi:MAG: hypothetical protein IT314_16015 [Anaerolineales bacterium]|nr:hypothetical protein [Anaerolineales bacterium]
MKALLTDTLHNAFWTLKNADFADKKEKTAFHLPLRAMPGSARFAVCVQNLKVYGNQPAEQIFAAKYAKVHEVVLISSRNLR